MSVQTCAYGITYFINEKKKKTNTNTKGIKSTLNKIRSMSPGPRINNGPTVGFGDMDLHSMNLEAIALDDVLILHDNLDHYHKESSNKMKQLKSSLRELTIRLEDLDDKHSEGLVL